MKQFATITVIGRDKTGVIARVTNFLFEQHANIEALEEQVTRGQFSMTLQASWKPSQCSLESIRRGMETLGVSLGMEVRVRFTEPRRRQRCAIFVTRETHCLDALMAEFKSGRIKNAQPVVIVSNRGDLAPLAKKYGLPFFCIPWDDRTKAEAEVLGRLDIFQVDFVVLARFMKILSPNFVWRFKNKIINMHPSLLPSFPGPQAYRQAYEHGVKIVGVTAHFVSMALDEGPIIAQGSFNVRANMTLKDIVTAGQKVEAKVLVKAVKLYLTKKLDVFWGVVKEV
ncbi:MAG: Formyl transferase [Verrucomicrobiales bacterium]|nr:Formyl transferase [Verrucomicrobiales bacterium]